MSKEQPNPDFEQAKADINKEGWEENAAVIIGTPEERAILRERLEKGEMAADLGTYIRMNKQLWVQQEDPEMSEDLKKRLEDMKGKYESSFGLLKDFYYVDGDGNIAKVNMDTSRISAYKNIPTPNQGYNFELKDKIAEDLEKLKFRSFDRENRQDLEADKAIWEAINKKRERLEKEAKERKIKEFDF